MWSITVSFPKPSLDQIVRSPRSVFEFKIAYSNADQRRVAELGSYRHYGHHGEKNEQQSAVEFHIVFQ